MFRRRTFCSDPQPLPSSLPAALVPALSPRQIHAMSTRSFNGVETRNIQAGVRGSVISEVPLEYLVKKLGGSQLMADGNSYAPNFSSQDQFEWPTLCAYVRGLSSC